MGPTLPHEMVFHCGTHLNETHGILTGGYFETRTLIVDLGDLQSMTLGPELSNNESYYACGSFQHENGTNYVVTSSFKNVEILNVDEVKNGWSKGTILVEPHFQTIHTNYVFSRIFCDQNIHDHSQ